MEGQLIQGGNVSFATVTIAAGQTVSGSIDLGLKRLRGIFMPAAWSVSAATEATAPAGTVSLGASGANTFDIYAASSAEATGSVAQTDGSIDTTTANQFTVSVDGGATQTITLTAGSNQTEASIRSQINGQLTGAAASWSSNHLVITSDSAGSGSSITIGAGGMSGGGTGDAASLFGLAIAETHGAAGNNQLNVSVNGGATTTITLTAGPAVTGATILSCLNGAGLGTIASLDGSNERVLAAPPAGAASELTITAPPNSAASLLGLTAVLGTTYHGTAGGASSLTFKVSADGENFVPLNDSDGTVPAIPGPVGANAVYMLAASMVAVFAGVRWLQVVSSVVQVDARTLTLAVRPKI
jgi:hypothetical protein